MPDAEFEKTQQFTLPAFDADLRAQGYDEVVEVGRGGFGVVYRARQASLDRTVAIKILSSDLDDVSRDRFVREQQAMGRLSGHPNIVHVLEVGVTTSGRPFIVMPYHRRDSLGKQIKQSGPLSWAEAFRVGVKMAGALETAHRIGTLHRDVKPANILLTDYGEPQLTDFGIARISNGFETTTGAITGSPAFTAPEVLEGRNATVAADLYSLGATLFALVTGHAAVERRDGESVVAQFVRLAKTPVVDLRPHGLPDDVAAAIEHAMARAPADRPGGAAEFGRELRSVERRHHLPATEMALPPAAMEDESPLADAVLDDAVGGSVPTGHASVTTTPPSAVTKFRPPSVGRSLVRRGRLIDVLRNSRRRRLILIHAPAGFGKSTLAAQWRDMLIADGVPVAWLTIDHDDDNVIWFLTHLLEAIHQALPDLVADGAQALEEGGAEAQRYVLTSLINEVHARRQLLVVVLDDWNRADNPETRAALAFLLDNGCHHLQFIVTSRSRKGLPVSRLRVRDELVEIDSAALRFDDEESSEFLLGRGGLQLGRDDLADLNTTTEGWAAALQLVSLSLRGRADPTTFIRRMSGRHRGISEYLAENVLRTLDAETLEFVTLTCIPTRVSGELADELSGRDDGHEMLEEIEQQDLFLERIDEDGEWFRYQRLFADYLRRRLARDDPSRCRELHLQAALWFGEHGLLNEAVEHALAAGDPGQAADLIERHREDLIERSKLGTILRLLGKLPADLVRSRPRLLLAGAWAKVMLFRPDRAELASVATAVDGLDPDDPATADLRVESDLIEAVRLVSTDHVSDVEGLVAECLRRPDTLPARFVGVAANVSSLACVYRFDYDTARQRQRWAAPYHRATTGPLMSMYAHCYAGMAAAGQLDIDAAEYHFRTAVELPGNSSATHSHPARLSGALLGELLYERGALEDAERLLDGSHALGYEGGITDFILTTIGTGSRLKALRGDLDAARDRLARGAAVASEFGLPRLAARITNERVRLGWEPDRSLDSDDGFVEDDPMSLRRWELDEDSRIRLLLAQNADQSTREALARARALLSRFRSSNRANAALRASVLVASCLAVLGEADAALDELAPAVSTCARLRLPRLLLDAGWQLAPVIATMADDAHNDRWPADRTRVPAEFLDELVAQSAG